MKTSSRPITYLALFFSFNVLLSCDKEKLQESISNSDPCYCFGLDLSLFNVSIKKLNTFPTGSQIFIEKFEHPKSDSSTIHTSNIFTHTLPFNDTLLLRPSSKNYTLYLKWKIVNAGNDSISGGTTHKLTTASNTINFDISY